MALKTFKPTTPGQRQLVIVDRTGLHKGKPVKALTEGKHSIGRPQQRRPHHRALPRRRPQADLSHCRLQAPQVRCAGDGRAASSTIRTAPRFIALIKYADGELAYILAPQRLAPGDEVIAGEQVDVKPGNAMPLGNIPVGTIVHNVEIKIGKGGQIARSAGTYAQIVGRDQDYVILRLNSGRAAAGAWPLHGDGRRGVEPRPHEYLDRQGRPQALARASAAQPRRHHEPDRPSAWRRRRPHLRRPASGDARGAIPTKGKKTRKNKSTDKFIVASRHARKKKIGEDAIMARSVWKGPFVDGYLLKKAEASRASGRHEVIKIWSRRSTILPQFVGLTFGVYNGQKHIPVMVTEEMVGHKFGEFSPTRTFHGHSADRKAKRA